MDTTNTLTESMPIRRGLSSHGGTIRLLQTTGDGAKFEIAIPVQFSKG
ncbi:hypothetical protein [Rhizobium sp. WYCCWR10014]|nr:hypothetical protein [Rhizobium sp. WYCCWR10014]